MPIALLLSMQAAGMITDYFGTSSQAEMAEKGAMLQQAAIGANLQQVRLEAEDESLLALKKLRQTMGTQIALFAARGTSPGAGSALSLVTENISNFNADERMRRLNLLGRENALKGEGLLSRLNQQSNNAALWQGFASRTLNRFPSTKSGWETAIKTFGG